MDVAIDPLNPPTIPIKRGHVPFTRESAAFYGARGRAARTAADAKRKAAAATVAAWAAGQGDDLLRRRARVRGQIDVLEERLARTPARDMENVTRAIARLVAVERDLVLCREPRTAAAQSRSAAAAAAPRSASEPD